MNNIRTIIYVNFAPYENAGNILDYLLDHYSTVISFTFNFHKISAQEHQSKLCVFKNKKLVYECRLFQTPTNAPVAFILLPIRSLVIFVQLLFHIIRLKNVYGPYNIYFTVNAFTAWSGNILRSLGLVQTSVFWVWDYYPPVHKDRIVMFMRWLYWQFDKPASLQADRVAFLNRHLYELRREIGILPKRHTYPIVEIGTDPHPSPKKTINKEIRLVFLGVLKQIQGLDLFFDAAPIVARRYPSLVLHIIGGGPDENHYQKRAQSCPLRVVFHGYVSDDQKVDDIIKRCHIGIAPYMPDKSNVMYYSDPSKIKRYLNFGIPSITTNVFDFSKTIERNNAGILIPYLPIQFADSIVKIVRNYPRYRNNASVLAQKIQYRVIYKKIFED